MKEQLEKIEKQFQEIRAQLERLQRAIQDEACSQVQKPWPAQFTNSNVISLWSQYFRNRPNEGAFVKVLTSVDKIRRMGLRLEQLVAARNFYRDRKDLLRLLPNNAKSLSLSRVLLDLAIGEPYNKLARLQPFVDNL